jgi:hypothetical protein
MDTIVISGLRRVYVVLVLFLYLQYSHFYGHLKITRIFEEEKKLRKKESTMAEERRDTGEHPMVSQDGVWRSSVAFRQRFDVSALGVSGTNAIVATPQVAAAAADGYSAVVDATQRTEENEDNGRHQPTQLADEQIGVHDEDDEDSDDEPRVLFPPPVDSQHQEPIPHAADKPTRQRAKFFKEDASCEARLVPVAPTPRECIRSNSCIGD